MTGDSTKKSDPPDQQPKAPVARRRRAGGLRLLDLIYEILQSREMTNNTMKLVLVMSLCLVVPLLGAAVWLGVQHQQVAAVASMSTAAVALLSSLFGIFFGRKPKDPPSGGSAGPGAAS